MIYKHFSSEESINSIYESKQLWLTRLVDCKGQKDFILDEKMFLDMISSLDYSKIKYKDIFPRSKFEKMCSYKHINKKYIFYSKNLYGVCITTDGTNKKFKEKYPDKYISFELDSIRRKNAGFLFIYDVVYKLTDIEQYVYDLAYILYINGEHQARHALELSEETLPDNFEDMFSRLFYYMKVLYKLSDFSFEKETRIFVDGGKLEKEEAEVFSGDGYCFTHDTPKIIYEKHIVESDNKYIMLLDSFPELELEKHI